MCGNIPPMRNDFSTFDIAKHLGIPRERLKDWMNQGFVRASIPAQGQGTRAVFTRVDVYSVQLFQTLINHGYQRKVAAQLVEKFVIDEGHPVETSAGVFPAEYLILREDKNGNIRLNTTHGGGNFHLHLDTGSISVMGMPIPRPITSRDTGPAFDKADWINLHAVNLKLVRKIVDDAFNV